MKLQEIVKTENILTATPNEPLSSTLTHLSSSHDAVFIFDDNKKFLGVVNPYICLIKTSYPGNAKLQHCLFHPPHIHIQDSISKVAQMMNESRLHYLPVFDDKDEFTGIISARRLLAVFADSPLFNIKINDVLKEKSRPLVTIYEDDILSHALTNFKEQRVSKLIVMSKDMKLKGILSHYDLISYLVAPKEKGHQGDREGTKNHLRNLKVKNLQKSYILTLTPDKKLSDALHLILEKKIGSVVIVDDEHHPLGIITTRDFLNQLKKHIFEKPIEITSKHLSSKNKKTAQQFFYKVADWMRKFPDIEKARIFIDEAKEGGLFKVMLSFIPKRGKPEVYQEEGKDLKKVLKKIKKD